MLKESGKRKGAKKILHKLIKICEGNESETATNKRKCESVPEK
jgi:hypothetical protein